MKQWTCNEEGLRLHQFLRDALGKAYSGRRLKRLIDHNHCRLNGRIERFGNTVLRAGDRIELVLEEGRRKNTEILFHDATLLVCNKPPGLDSYEVAEQLRAQLVHRLDRDTSGAMVLACSDWARRALEQQFARRIVEKRYLAVVDGIPRWREGVVKNRLKRISRFSGQTVWGPSRSGQPAITQWRLLDTGDACALLECFPETGRTHQIRVHLAGLGHPILGDGQYGTRFRCVLPVTRHLLHAERLSFNDPTSGRRLHFRVPKPKDFPL